MPDQERNCTGLNLDEARFSAEFRDVVNALFCACLSGTETRGEQLPRHLFRLVQLENMPIAKAANLLGLTLPEAQEMLRTLQRDIAVLMALGLSKPACGDTTGTRCNPSAPVKPVGAPTTRPLR